MRVDFGKKLCGHIVLPPSTRSNYPVGVNLCEHLLELRDALLCKVDYSTKLIKHILYRFGPVSNVLCIKALAVFLTGKHHHHQRGISTPLPPLEVEVLSLLLLILQ